MALTLSVLPHHAIARRSATGDKAKADVPRCFVRRLSPLYGASLLFCLSHRNLRHKEPTMRLDEKAFWEHVEMLKADNNEKGLELWLTHGLPIYQNCEQLMELYDKREGQR